VNAVKDHGGYVHVWQQIDNVDFVNRLSQIYASLPIGRRDAHELDKRFELLGRTGRQPTERGPAASLTHLSLTAGGLT
jgi:hypothetical protein